MEKWLGSARRSEALTNRRVRRVFSSSKELKFEELTMMEFLVGFLTSVAVMAGIAHLVGGGVPPAAVVDADAAVVAFFQAMSPVRGIVTVVDAGIISEGKGKSPKLLVF